MEGKNFRWAAVSSPTIQPMKSSLPASCCLLTHIPTHGKKKPSGALLCLHPPSNRWKEEEKFWRRCCLFTHIPTDGTEPTDGLLSLHPPSNRWKEKKFPPRCCVFTHIPTDGTKPSDGLLSLHSPSNRWKDKKLSARCCLFTHIPTNGTKPSDGLLSLHPHSNRLRTKNLPAGCCVFTHIPNNGTKPSDGLSHLFCVNPLNLLPALPQPHHASVCPVIHPSVRSHYIIITKQISGPSYFHDCTADWSHICGVWSHKNWPKQRRARWMCQKNTQLVGDSVRRPGVDLPAVWKTRICRQSGTLDPLLVCKLWEFDWKEPSGGRLWDCGRFQL